MIRSVAMFLSLALPFSAYGASISSLDFEMADDGAAGPEAAVESREDRERLQYVEHPKPAKQVIINNNRCSDVIIQKKSSNVFRHSGSKGSEARSNIGGLRTNSR